MHRGRSRHYSELGIVSVLGVARATGHHRAGTLVAPERWCATRDASTRACAANLGGMLAEAHGRRRLTLPALCNWANDSTAALQPEIAGAQRHLMNDRAKVAVAPACLHVPRVAATYSCVLHGVIGTLILPLVVLRSVDPWHTQWICSLMHPAQSTTSPRVTQRSSRRSQSAMKARVPVDLSMKFFELTLKLS
mgnify:CR=1 FL=1